MNLVLNSLRSVCLVALAAATASCAATPQYPLSESAPEGPGGVKTLKPQYAVSDAPASVLTPAPAPVRGVQLAEAQTTAPTPGKAQERASDAGQVSSAPIAAAVPASPPPAPQKPEPKAVPQPPPREVIVADGETIYDIAAKRRAPVRAIIEANHLSEPYSLHAGQRLVIPQPAVYEVAEGDTLFGVSRRFGVDVGSLVALNDLTLQSHLRLGQRVLLPTHAKDHGVDPRANGVLAPSAVAAEAVREASTEAEANYPRVHTEDAQAATPAKSSHTGRRTSRTPEDAIVAAQKSTTATALGSPLPTTSDDAAAVAAGKGKFVWPVDGQVTGRFGPTNTGQKNDGVDLAAAPNTPVAAAADGEVVYANSTIPAYGNLVLIKHANGWVTAYAHLAKISVKMREVVSQGETIGLVGDSGSPGVFQLHFELRYAPTPSDKARPVDPILVIPR